MIHRAIVLMLTAVPVAIVGAIVHNMWASTDLTAILMILTAIPTSLFTEKICFPSKRRV